MKHCEEYAALLDLFVDGELSPEDMADVQSHLDACAVCRAYVDDALTIRAAFPDAEDTMVPNGFAERVMTAVYADAAKKKAKKKTIPWHKVLMPLAACCAIVIVLQNGPVSIGGAKEEAAPAAEKPKAAMMDMARTEEAKAEAESILEMDIAEEPAMGANNTPMEAQTAPAESDRNTAAKYVEGVTLRAEFALRLEIPAEAARFLEGFPPAEETDTEVLYHLTEEEADTLLGQLDHAGIAGLAEAGIDPVTDTVLVVLKK